VVCGVGRGVLCEGGTLCDVSVIVRRGGQGTKTREAGGSSRLEDAAGETDAALPCERGERL